MKKTFCSKHRRKGMVDNCPRECSKAGCSTKAQFGNGYHKKRRFCFSHKKKKMVNIARGPAGNKRESYGFTGW